MRTTLCAIPLAAALAAAAPTLTRASEKQHAPQGLVTVEAGSESVTLWPWTASNFGTPSDPVNLIFLGDADPRQIRQALLDLDGFRGNWGFPNVPPFDCTWSDAIGAPETAWGTPEGWTGSAVGLQCGEYATLRFHLRLFRQGSFTIGGAHFELLIPGTSQHEVLSWELAEALVKADLARAGALRVAPELTPVINAAPTWRAIRAPIFNAVPPPLRAALGLPTTNQTADVPIPSDGRASLLTVVQTFEPESSDLHVVFDHPFGQVVPRPFCASGPGDLIRIQGALRYDHRVQTNPSGRYAVRFTATGTLQVTPIDPVTFMPSGPAVPAVVSETYRFELTDQREQVRLDRQQSILGDPAQLLFEMLDAGHSDRYELALDCGAGN